MKAIIMEQAGTANDLKAVTVDNPPLGADEVMVEVRYTALNRIDLAFMSGSYPPHNGFPAILGSDFSGDVIAVGEQVTEFAVGDAVMVMNEMDMGGGLAEYAPVNVKNVVKKPDAVSFPHAAALGIAASTAYQLVNEAAAVKAGDIVLVNGGSGGVGLFTVQFAKLNGAEVYATTSRNEDMLRKLGVDRVLNYQDEDVARTLYRSVDVLIDTVGHGDEVLDAVKDGGRAATPAAAFNEDVAGARDIQTAHIIHRVDKGQLTEILRLVADGKIKVVIDEIFPFTAEGAADAFERVGSGHAAGKLLIKVI